MHRRFIACILVALIAQASAVEAQQTLLENFPSYSQDDTGWCAWVSAQMVLKYYGYSVPPQKVAVKTFELANEKWGLDAVKADKNGLNSDRIPDYENAIIALSDNSLEIEEITARDKDELLYEIFDSIDSGRPIIVLSTAPWLYEVYGGKYPDGAHASVIAGYSLDFETNENLADHPFDLYPGVLASLVSSPPALRLYDPATAALGEGAYWLSYEHFFDETTSSEEFLTLIVVNKGSNEDTNFPKVQAFTVSSNAINSGATFTIDYAVSDNGGSGLAQVELWRKDETSDWQEIKRNSLAGENGPISGSFRDSPSASGKYWYGVHVVDNAGNWNDERNSNTDHQPTSFEPIEVEVIVSGLQSTTLNPPTTPTAIIIAEDIKMGDNNGRSKIEYRQDFIIEHVLTNTYLVFADVSGVEGLDEWNWYSYNDVFLNGAYLTTMNDITDSGLKIKIDESLLTMGVNTIVIRSGLTDRNKEPFDDFSIGRIILVGENISVVTL